MTQFYLAGLIMIPGIILAIYAQIKVNTTYQKYSRIESDYGRPAHEIARIFLDRAGLQDVEIIRVRGHLTDYYDPKRKCIALSEDVYDSTSVAAIGVACHEVGHAIQYKENYLPIKIRNTIIPICNFANNALWILIFLGALFFYADFGLAFIWTGVVIFSISIILNLVTLPVEYNASNRAAELLYNSAIFSEDEVNCTKQVLRSAGLTYVASLVVSILNLARLLLLLFSSSRRD